MTWIISHILLTTLDVVTRPTLAANCHEITEYIRGTINPPDDSPMPFCRQPVTTSTWYMQLLQNPPAVITKPYRKIQNAVITKHADSCHHQTHQQPLVQICLAAVTRHTKPTSSCRHITQTQLMPSRHKTHLLHKRCKTHLLAASDTSLYPPAGCSQQVIKSAYWLQPTRHKTR